MVWSKSSQKISMIFFIPHASWEGRVICTLLVDAVVSDQRFVDVGFFFFESLDLTLLLCGDFICQLGVLLLLVDDDSAGSLTPSVISLTIGDTSTWPPMMSNMIERYEV